MGRHDFIMNRVITDVVDAASQLGCLPLDQPLGHLCCFKIRQPGECRNLRVRQSIRRQDLISLGIVGYAGHSPESRRLHADR
jgi:hypothetical protein